MKTITEKTIKEKRINKEIKTLEKLLEMDGK